MKVLLAKSSGFCMGVKRAIDMALRMQKESKKKVYIYGDLIHSKQVVEWLRKKGIVSKKRYKTGENAIVIIRAHGTTPLTKKRLQEKGLEVVDATCPIVYRSQKSVSDYSKKGFNIIIVGDKRHSEVTGLLGYATTVKFVVTTPREAEKVKALEPTCVLAQTTFSRGNFIRIKDIIKKRFKRVKVFDTICSWTENRQKEVVEMAKMVDAIVVVGGYHSANTKRLAGISKKTGIPTIHIETASELQKKMLKGYNVVGITTGTSTPDWAIKEVVDKIKQF